jgi:hypothetical protein
MKTNSTGSTDTNSDKSVDKFTTGLFFDSSLPIISFVLLLLLIA